MRLENYIDKNVVIQCENIEEAIELMELADEVGYVWRNGERYTKVNHRWRDYEERSCYNLFSGGYGSIEYYKNCGFNVIKFNDIKINRKYLSKNKIQNEYSKFH